MHLLLFLYQISQLMKDLVGEMPSEVGLSCSQIRKVESCYGCVFGYLDVGRTLLSCADAIR